MRITVLDGQELALTGELLVIADRNVAVAMANPIASDRSVMRPSLWRGFSEP